VAVEIGLHERTPDRLKPMSVQSCRGKLLLRRYPPLYVSQTVSKVLALAKHQKRGTALYREPLMEWPARLVCALEDAIAEMERSEAAQ
jgi:hypothetical protein